MSPGPAEDARGLGLWRDNAQLEAAGLWEADPAVSRAAAELALTTRWISLPASLLFVYSHLHYSIFCFILLLFLHTLPFALIQLKHWLSAAFFPPWSSFFTRSLSCEHEGWRAEADVSPLAAGMSLFFQGTASECSAALSTLPQGSCFWQYFWTVLFLSGVRTRVGIVTPVLQMLRDLNSVHFLCFTKEGHSMWRGKRNPVGTAISPVYFLY